MGTKTIKVALEPIRESAIGICLLLISPVADQVVDDDEKVLALRQALEILGVDREEFLKGLDALEAMLAKYGLV